MSLPKRDGVNDRYYLIHKSDTALEVLAGRYLHTRYSGWYCS